MTAELREIKVIKAWKQDLKWWRAQSVDDRAQMMAYEIFMSTCEQYRDEWKEARRKNKSGGASNPYEAALKGFGIPSPLRPGRT